jgi:phosphodiesterase/alkaline phosphatase D-like protein
MSSLKSERQNIEENKNWDQLEVAQAMNTYYQKAHHKPKFVVALGDNFYTKGQFL